MTSPYRLLSERIQGEVPKLERVVQRALTAWSKASRMPEEDMYLDAVALNLHGFYAGVERLFELIARRIDHNIPKSQTWHRDLLQLMAQDIPDMRPAVIGQDEVRGVNRRIGNLWPCVGGATCLLQYVIG